MLASVLALLLGLTGDGWTAAGFMANPAPGPGSGPAPVVTPDIPTAPIIPPPVPHPLPDAPPAGPTRWRLTDATGQVWEHTDKAWLEAWVSERNRQRTLSALIQPNQWSAPGSSCTVDRFGRRQCPR